MAPRHVVVRGILTDSLERADLRNEEKPRPTLAQRQAWVELRRKQEERTRTVRAMVSERG